VKTTLNIPEGLVKKTMQLSKSKTKTEAIIAALEEYIRRKKLEGIVGLEGKLRFFGDWEKVRHER
jgi:hypothetical protein